jgi:transcriptional regulator with XRE-family HTH domain
MAGRSGSGKRGSPELADLLRKQREAMGLSRRDLADATGLSYPYISQLETADRRPSPEAMHTLARALDLEPGRLFDTLSPDEPATASAGTVRRQGTSRSPSHYLPNPLHAAAAPPPSALPDQTDPVLAAVAALESVPAEQRLAALNEVQAAVVAGLVGGGRPGR